ncbi:hypothetical protein CC86DRAFT_465975 [Ophiobolus disseminans]|uniref:Uncharacterized protein n=1 Tax=Ophiobolus disseminans TaxID=1469910 RepID=A0A6A7A657_9PLEO|nr:hypothetical protein CC86DRAFT_465975 [Ophiobolus disseminans]
MTPKNLAGTKRGFDDILTPARRSNVEPKGNVHSPTDGKGSSSATAFDIIAKRHRIAHGNELTTLNRFALQAKDGNAQYAEDDNEMEVEGVVSEERVLHTPGRTKASVRTSKQKIPRAARAPHSSKSKKKSAPINTIQLLANTQNAAGGSHANIFNVPLPERFTPWPFSYGQATLQFTDDIPCPVNWSALAAVSVPLKHEHIATYEARHPWSPNPLSFIKVIPVVQEVIGRRLSQEGVRKWFRKANLAIYNATGVYFIHSSIGLEDHDIPTDKEMGTEIAKAGISPSKASKQAKNVHKPDDSSSPFDVAAEYVPATAIILQLPGRAIIKQRFISEEVAKMCGIEHGQRIACSVETFGQWYTCLCFGLRHSFPKRLYSFCKPPGGRLKHHDDGVSRFTIHTLLETYYLSQAMKTTDVSDMLLDQLLKVFQNEKALYAKYKGRGCICEVDPNAVLRFMDLEQDGMNELWKNTELGDPIRKLIVDLLTFGLETSEKQVAAAVRSSRHARELYAEFAQKYHPHDVIDDFANATYTDHFCANYHNHAEDELCYAWRPPSALSKNLDDDLPSMQSLEIAGVPFCRVPNNTGEPFDISLYQARHPEIDWKMVRSMNSLITFPSTAGPQRREPRPVFVDEEDFDVYGRWPTHPGYNNKDWEAPEEEQDGYKDKWERAKHQDIPRDARKKRTEADGKVTFEIPDEDWNPPTWFLSERQHEPEETCSEYQRYRMEMWIQDGNTLPVKKCVRFRPFEGIQDTLWTDPFKDRKS